MNVQVFWHITPLWLVKITSVTKEGGNSIICVNQSKKCHSSLFCSGIAFLRRWRHLAPPKWLYRFIRWHGVTSEKNRIFNGAVRIWNLPSVLMMICICSSGSPDLAGNCVSCLTRTDVTAVFLPSVSTLLCRCVQQYSWRYNASHSGLFELKSSAKPLSCQAFRGFT